MIMLISNELISMAISCNLSPHVIRSGMQCFYYFDLNVRNGQELIIYLRKHTASHTHHDVNSSDLNTTIGMGNTGSHHSSKINNVDKFDDDTKKKLIQKKRNTSSRGDNSQSFLLGAYTRYNWPQVWRLSHHCNNKNNKNNIDNENTTNDVPLALISTRDWKKRQCRVWDFVHEVVKTYYNSSTTGNEQKEAHGQTDHITIKNAFKIDFDALGKRAVEEQCLLAGALLSFLRFLVEHFVYKKDEQYDDCGDIFLWNSEKSYREIISDMRQLASIHSQHLHSIFPATEGV